MNPLPRNRPSTRARFAIIAIVAFVASVAPYGAPANAQDDVCFGQRATIVVRTPGRVTYGTEGNDVIIGTSGSDIIRGRGGQDRICGRGGNDRIYGGGGNDFINAGGGADRAYGNSGDDTIKGSTGADRLSGGPGRDAVSGNKGNDLLLGGRASDRLRGGSGTDRCVANTGRGSFGGCEDYAAKSAGCIMLLHGAGTAPGSLQDEDWPGGLRYLTPHSGSDVYPWFWLYDGPHDAAHDPGDSNRPYNRLVGNLEDTLDANGCGPVFIHGTSNGGGFAARIYCSGEDFGGRLWGVMVDDPVPDAGVVGCSPSREVEFSLFVHSTEIMAEAARFENNRCSRSPTLLWPWYCQDDVGFGLAEYEAHIGQRSYNARATHGGANSYEYSFWTQILGWWHDYDPQTYDDLSLWAN